MMERNNPNNSQLVSIVNRLYAMTLDTTKTIQERRFNLFDLEIIKVTYDHEQEIFIVDNRNVENTFTFDDLEMAAVEIYVTLREVEMTF